MPPFQAWKIANPARHAELAEACGGSAEAETAWYQLAVECEAEGVALERARCVAHAELGVACGDITLAREGVASGASVESMLGRYVAFAFRTRIPEHVQRTQSLATKYGSATCSGS